MAVIEKDSFEPDKFVVKLLNVEDKELIPTIELNRENEGQSIEAFYTRLKKAVWVWEQKVNNAIEQTKAQTIGLSVKDLQSIEIPLMPHFRGHLGLSHIEQIKTQIETWFVFAKAPKNIIDLNESNGFPYVLRPYFFDGIDGLFTLQKTPFSRQRIPVLFFVFDEYVKLDFADKLKYFDGVFEGLSYNFKGFIDSSDLQKQLIIQEIKKPIKVPTSNVDLVEYGNRVGRLFKAWSIILQSPDYFIDSFENEPVAETSVEKVELETESQTKAEILKPKFKEFGFMKWPKVEVLTESSQNELIKLIAENKTPYKIAMLNEIECQKYLLSNYFQSNNELFKAIGKWFNVAERTIKGNFNVLSELSTDNKERYTSYNYKEKVKKDYQSLI
ncbi:MAG: hypothetical protein JXQ87_08990 [Bacteroidia bacterium]